MKPRIYKAIVIFLMSFFVHQKGHANVYESGLVSNAYVDAELLYWQARVNGMPYAATGIDPTSEGNLHEVDWNWDPGFRVGAGILLGCDPWDLSLTYTWFKNISRGEFNGDNFGVFFPVVLNVFANGAWHFSFKTLDLNLKKNVCFFDSFTLTPLLSVRSAFIKDSFITNGIPPAAVLSPGINSNNFQKLCGIGPRVGLSAAFCFWHNLSLFVETDFSLLLAKYSVKTRDLTIGGFAPGSVTQNTKNSFYALRFVPEYRIGIQGDYCLCSDLYRLNVLVAWEEQLWMNYNQMLYGLVNPPILINRNTSLSLYGLTLRTQLLF